eukprot:1177231-Prorocentrum_minimum.AAC.3
MRTDVQADQEGATKADIIKSTVRQLARLWVPGIRRLPYDHRALGSQQSYTVAGEKSRTRAETAMRVENSAKENYFK